MARINIGCDVFKIPGIINVDIRWDIKPNAVMNIKKQAFKDSVATEITLGNILEHLMAKDLPVALKECHRILMAGGVLYITVPLIDRAQILLNRREITLDAFCLILQGDVGYQSHKTEFRTGDVERLLQENGYRPEPLDITTFPYLIVSNVRDPRPDPWQYGVKGVKI